MTIDFNPRSPDNEKTVAEILNEMFRQYLNYRRQGQQIHEKRLAGKIINILLGELSPNVRSGINQDSPRGDAWINTWIYVANKFDPNYPNANLIHYFNKQYKFRLRDAERPDRKRVKNPQANNGDSKQSKTRSEYIKFVSLDKQNEDSSFILLDAVVKDEDGKMTIYQQEERLPPSFINLMAFVKSKLEELRKISCCSVNGADVFLLIAEYYDRGEQCNKRKLRDELGLTSQFYNFFKKDFIPLVRELVSKDFEQSKYNRESFETVENNEGEE